MQAGTGGIRTHGNLAIILPRPAASMPGLNLSDASPEWQFPNDIPVRHVRCFRKDAGLIGDERSTGRRSPRPNYEVGSVDFFCPKHLSRHLHCGTKGKGYADAGYLLRRGGTAGAMHLARTVIVAAAGVSAAVGEPAPTFGAAADGLDAWQSPWCGCLHHRFRRWTQTGLRRMPPPSRAASAMDLGRFAGATSSRFRAA